MNAKELAMLLTGREYCKEIDRAEEHQAKAAGLIVAFGASDDLLELRGAIHDETYPSGGTGARVDAKGVVPSFQQAYDDGEDALRDYFKRENGGAVIRAAFEGEPGYTWIISTDAPHETFEIVEDGEPYCRGIVFTLADLPSGVPSNSSGQPASGAAHAGYSTMQPHQQRVVDEKSELDGRLQKLTTFLDGSLFASLSTAEQRLLMQQRLGMQFYSDVLGERIAIFMPA